MKNIVAVFLSCFISFSVWGQSWDVRVGTTSLLKSLDITQNVFRFNSIQVLNDSLGVNTSVSSTRLDSFSVTQILTYDIGIGKRFDIGRHWEARFGFGVHFSAYRQQHDFGFLGSTTTILDTVPIENGTFTPVFACDQTTNSPTDFETRPYDMVAAFNLEINSELKKWLLNKKLAIGLGMDLSTPLYTEFRQDRIVLTRSEVDGETICTFRFDSDNNRSGNGFRNLKIGARAFAEYRINQAFSVHLGYRQQFSNTYIVHNSTFSTFQSNADVFRPRSIFANVSYRFNRGKNQQADNNQI